MSLIQNKITSVIPIGGVATLTGDTGGPVSPTAGNINVVGGSGIATSGSGDTLTISSTMLGTWTEVTGTSANMAVDNGYIANNVGLVTLTLPAVAAVGDGVRVAGKGSGLWSIAQNAGQTIFFGAASTTTGVLGSLDAIAQYDCVELLCITANNDWVVISSVGNLSAV